MGAFANVLDDTGSGSGLSSGSGGSTWSLSDILGGAQSVAHTAVDISALFRGTSAQGKFDTSGRDTSHDNVGVGSNTADRGAAGAADAAAKAKTNWMPWVALGIGLVAVVVLVKVVK